MRRGILPKRVRRIAYSGLAFALAAAFVAMPSAAIGYETTCQGKVVTITGSGAIRGTTGDDVIRGSAGDDLIDGSHGIDTICAGDGDDLVRDLDGGDAIEGGAGDNHVISLGAPVGRGGVDVAWGCAVAPNVEASIFPDQTLGAVQASHH
jgi:Ca2+-binding RTX toxin-like protein